MQNDSELFCTLSSQERKQRRSTLRELVISKVLSSQSVPDGFQVEFEDSELLRAQVEEFVSAEKGCCGFLTFTISEPADGLSLLIQGPPEAANMIEIFRSAITSRVQ